MASTDTSTGFVTQNINKFYTYQRRPRDKGKLKKCLDGAKLSEALKAGANARVVDGGNGDSDGLVNQTLNNLGLERTPEIEAKFWAIPSHERASIAARLLNRDSTVSKDLKGRLS